MKTVVLSVGIVCSFMGLSAADEKPCASFSIEESGQGGTPIFFKTPSTGKQFQKKVASTLALVCRLHGCNARGGYYKELGIYTVTVAELNTEKVSQDLKEVGFKILSRDEMISNVKKQLSLQELESDSSPEGESFSSSSSDSFSLN